VSKSSQVRSTYFSNHPTQPELGNRAIVICDRNLQTVIRTAGLAFWKCESPRSDKTKRLGAHSAHRRA